MKQIAFIGLGHMGAPMATNLLKAGYLLNVFDLVQSAVDGLVAAGASAARSARDAVQGADVVISMLPASQHVEGLYLDDDGLLAHIAPGTLVLECSTIAPTSARKVHAAARERGLAMLDAPVSGGTAGAAAGTLTFMVGGDAEALEKARPLFEAMGRNIFHAGPDGAGQVAKVCNNQLLAVVRIASEYQRRDEEQAPLLGLDQLNPQELFSRAWESAYGSGPDAQALDDFASLLQSVELATEEPPGK